MAPRPSAHVERETRLNTLRENRRHVGAQGQLENGRFGEDEMPRTALFHKIFWPWLSADSRRVRQSWPGLGFLSVIPL